MSRGRGSFYLFFMLLFTFLLVLNACFGTQSDDVGLALMPRFGLDAALHSYLNWNGRIFELARLAFFPYDASLFDVINAAAGTLVFYLFYRLIFGTRVGENSLFYLCVIFIFITILFGYASVFCWDAGSCSYLYPTVFILVVLNLWRSGCDISFRGGLVIRYKNYSPLFYPFIFLASLLAGWGSEQIAFITLLCLLALSLYLAIPSLKRDAYIAGGGGEPLALL